MKIGQFLVVSLLAWVTVQPTPPAPAVAGERTPAAVLMSCQGDVRVVRKGGGAVSGAFGLPLEPGDRIQTGAGAEVEILFEGGQCIQVGSESSMEIRESKSGRSEAEKPMGDGGFDVVQNFIKLKSEKGTSSLSGLRGVEKPAGLEPVSPRETRVLAARPTFEWEASDPNESVTLTVYDERGVVWKQEVDGKTSIDYPNDAPALEPGTTYSWALETSDPLRVPPLRSSAVFFEMTPPDEARALQHSLSAIDKQTSMGPETRRLLRASLFYNHGLVGNAIAETETALAASPDDTGLRAILARLYAKVGRDRDALSAYDEAGAAEAH